ncbi:ATP-binding protein [Streptacidiphilus melanogenes]|uniref:preATP grasp domain-containing protein n=1 Tax=Streptacidiphilus melanogenes TaxID=411235 RepID=UPI0005A6B186|nr:ATP-grasp domain-containing protein [Streptacidiphilus melanogenes]
MDETESGFRARLGRAVTGSPVTPLLFLGNFEVENSWAEGEPALPRVGSHAGSAVVNRMDEFALLLGGADDHVVLKAAPDPDYLDQLRELGIPTPTVHVPARQDPLRTVTEDALDDPGLLDALRRDLAPLGVQVVAHGVSLAEEEFAARTGLRLAAPAAALCKHVNSKIYSRLLADELSLRQAPGRTCETTAQLAEAVEWARGPLAGGSRVAVKDAYGVSGKGIVVIDNVRRLERLARMAVGQAGRAGSDRLALVVEEWVDKSTDLNYQFTVARDGSVRFDFVKEALTERGVHKGHRMPARLTAAQDRAVREAAALLGGKLAGDGWFGVVGVDAMVDPDGGLYPVVEINARHNMSTYQAVLNEGLMGPDAVAVARHYPVRTARPLRFAELRDALSGLLLAERGGTGLLVNNFATVNAAAATGGEGPFEGRLYGVVVAADDAATARLDAEVAGRLAALEAAHTQLEGSAE